MSKEVKQKKEKTDKPEKEESGSEGEDQESSFSELEEKSKGKRRSDAKEMANDADIGSEKAEVVEPGKRAGPAVVEDKEGEEGVEKKIPKVEGEGDKDEESKEEEAKGEEKKTEKVAKDAQETEIFINNLAYAATQEQIQEFFEKYGKVLSVKIHEKNGKPSGKAWVKFGSAEEANKALGANEQELCGRQIQVSLARNANQEGAGSAPRTGQSGSTNTIFIGGISFKSTEESLSSCFGKCGAIKAVRIAKKEDGSSKGFAHIEFETTDAVESALKMSGTDIDGRTVRIDRAEARKPGEGSPGKRGGFRGGRGGFGGGFGGRGRGDFRGGRGRGDFRGRGRGDFRGRGRGGFGGHRDE